VLGRSVDMTCATISTACPWSPCFRTKSSLARIAQADPSDVGLESPTEQRKSMSDQFTRPDENKEELPWHKTHQYTGDTGVNVKIIT